MSDNFFKVYKGLSLRPISSDPANPIEGDIQFSDGTARSKGLWEYKDSAWSSIGGGSSSFSGFIVGSTPDATHATIALAIAASSAGQKITLLDETFTENVVIDVSVHIIGMGRNSLIDGTVTFATGSSNSSMELVKITDDLTFDVGIVGVQVNTSWQTNSKLIIDNGSDNYWAIIEE